jgi:pantetheine-phosphate adenylyltransferase
LLRLFRLARQAQAPGRWMATGHNARAVAGAEWRATCCKPRISKEHTMSRRVVAVYPGTFDPITLGHEDILRRSVAMFDHVIVAVAAAYHKKTLFTLDERLAQARESAKALGDAVSVQPFDGLVRDFVRANDAKVMVRGVRSATDFDYEVQLGGMNRNLMPDVETIFLLPDSALQYVSSTFVRDIGLLGTEVERFVSPHVAAAMAQKKAERNKPGA